MYISAITADDGGWLLPMYVCMYVCVFSHFFPVSAFISEIKYSGDGGWMLQLIL